MNPASITTAPDSLSSARGRADSGAESAGEGRFDWSLLVPVLVHPVRVFIVEALWSVGEAASPTDLTRMLDGVEREAYSVSLVAYHANFLRGIGVLEIARRAQTGRNLETFYRLAEQL